MPMRKTEREDFGLIMYKKRNKDENGEVNVYSLLLLEIGLNMMTMVIRGKKGVKARLPIFTLTDSDQHRLFVL